MITIFDEPAIASPSLVSDIKEADTKRDSYARLIADDAVAGKPLEPFYAEGYAEHTARFGRLHAALTERVRRDDIARAKRDQDAAFATYVFVQPPQPGDAIDPGWTRGCGQRRPVSQLDCTCHVGDYHVATSMTEVFEVWSR